MPHYNKCIEATHSEIATVIISNNHVSYHNIMKEVHYLHASDNWSLVVCSGWIPDLVYVSYTMITSVKSIVNYNSIMVFILVHVKFATAV